jgi:hypothetical protein
MLYVNDLKDGNERNLTVFEKFGCFLVLFKFFAIRNCKYAKIWRVFKNKNVIYAKIWRVF